MTGSSIGDANATCCATLVDEWVRCGVRHAVIAPGSRSTPLALALASRAELDVHVVHDERVAAFAALGLGLAGTPAVLTCTSGTAAANFLPAVVEAGLSEVPMIVATADRPPELRNIGSAQTIDQLELYGRSVRWFHDAPPSDDADPATWRPLAQRVFATTSAGPVHLNLPFREPLIGVVGDLPDPIGPPLPIPRGIATGGPAAEYDRQRGVIVAGGRSGVEADAVTDLAARLGWPILADPCSGLRDTPYSVTAFEPMLRFADFADAHAPEVVVRVGRAPASKTLAQWIARSGAPVLQVGGPGVVDPDRNVAAFCSLDDLAPLTGAASTPWLARWRHADERAEAVIGAALDGALNEPAVARAVAEVGRASGAPLVAASSMPIRDVEWYGGRTAEVHANRGANGIDGVLSTALGLALGGRTVLALVGDIAFVHDSNALVAIRDRGVDLRIVVVDNDGGGIFHFLPQATALPGERFEQLFGTPHGTDLVTLAGAHRVDACTVSTIDQLRDRLTIAGPTVTRIATDRVANVVVHDDLNSAVAQALSSR